MKLAFRYYLSLAKIPGWLLVELEERGIPMNFREGDLTEEQIVGLDLLATLAGMVKKGLIRPEVIDGVVNYHATELGEAVRKRSSRERWDRWDER